MLATDEQLAQMTKLLEVVKIGDDVVAKWFKKSNVESFNEMPSDIIAKCIEFADSLLKSATHK